MIRETHEYDPLTGRLLAIHYVYESSNADRDPLRVVPAAAPPLLPANRRGAGVMADRRIRLPTYTSSVVEPLKTCPTPKLKGVKGDPKPSPLPLFEQRAPRSPASSPSPLPTLLKKVTADDTKRSQARQIHQDKHRVLEQELIASRQRIFVDTVEAPLVSKIHEQSWCNDTGSRPKLCMVLECDTVARDGFLRFCMDHAETYAPHTRKVEDVQQLYGLIAKVLTVAEAAKIQTWCGQALATDVLQYKALGVFGTTALKVHVRALDRNIFWLAAKDMPNYDASVRVDKDDKDVVVFRSKVSPAVQVHVVPLGPGVPAPPTRVLTFGLTDVQVQNTFTLEPEASDARVLLLYSADDTKYKMLLKPNTPAHFGVVEPLPGVQTSFFPLYMSMPRLLDSTDFLWVMQNIANLDTVSVKTYGACSVFALLSSGQSLSNKMGQLLIHMVLMDVGPVSPDYGMLIYGSFHMLSNGGWAVVSSWRIKKKQGSLSTAQVSQIRETGGAVAAAAMLSVADVLPPGTAVLYLNKLTSFVPGAGRDLVERLRAIGQYMDPPGVVVLQAASRFLVDMYAKWGFVAVNSVSNGAYIMYDGKATTPTVPHCPLFPVVGFADDKAAALSALPSVQDKLISPMRKLYDSYFVSLKAASVLGLKLDERFMKCAEASAELVAARFAYLDALEDVRLVTPEQVATALQTKPWDSEGLPELTRRLTRQFRLFVFTGLQGNGFAVPESSITDAMGEQFTSVMLTRFKELFSAKKTEFVEYLNKLVPLSVTPMAGTKRHAE